MDELGGERAVVCLNCGAEFNLHSPLWESGVIILCLQCLKKLNLGSSNFYPLHSNLYYGENILANYGLGKNRNWNYSYWVACLG